MRYELLERVVGELAVLLPGARVDKVVQGGNGDIYLLLHRRRDRLVLLASADRRLPRVHLVSARPSMTPKPSGLLLLLRKYLSGSLLENIEIIRNDRIVDIRFAARDRRPHLVCELTGSTANIVLTDQEHRILGALYPVPLSLREKRPLLPGMPYEPPEARGLPLRGGGDDLPAVSEHGAPDSINRAVAEWTAGKLEEKAAGAEHSSLGSTIRKALARSERKVEAVRRDLAEADRADEHRRAGELILANLAGLRRGQEQAVLPDGKGGQVTLPLDPSKTPAENAAYQFRRYKKYKAAASVLGERLDDAREGSDLLKLALDDAGRARGLADLQAIRQRLVRLGLLSDRQRRPGGRKTEGASTHRTFNIEGWEVLVGRNAAGNDHITTRIARSGDLWLHAEGMPGSHVLIRNPGQRDIPPQVLHAAAGLAAYHSAGRASTKVPVACTDARHVRKPKGARPGSVVLAERRTMMIMPAKPS